MYHPFVQIEVRRSISHHSSMYALYGVSHEGDEYGIVSSTSDAQGMRALLTSLIVQLDKFEEQDRMLKP